jgi:4-hydroxybenzoate polyprenyltransferase
MTRLRAWLELTRGANLPTVWSNVLIGWLLAVAAGSNLAAGSAAGLGWVLLGASFLYAAGMFLNDAADAAWDAAHRPERPVPSGRVSSRAAGLAGGVLLLLGATACHLASPAAGAAGLVLASLVLAYTRWHKSRPALAPWLMGACRTLLPLVGFLANPPDSPAGILPLVLAHALALGLLTAGISLLARHEAVGGEPGRLARALPLLAALPVPAVLLAQGAAPWVPVVWACGLMLLPGWSRRRHADVGERVAFRIATLALLDYLAWLAVRSRFESSDPLSMGGLMLLLFFGTALALRRLLPST